MMVGEILKTLQELRWSCDTTTVLLAILTFKTNRDGIYAKLSGLDMLSSQKKVMQFQFAKRH